MFNDGDEAGASGTGGITFWFIVFAVISAGLFGFYVPQFVARHHAPVLDLEPGHTAARTLELMAAYGVLGRHDFLVFLTIDCLFPVAGSMFVIAILRSAFAYLGATQRKVRAAIVVAALPAVFDLSENGIEALLVVSYPHFGEPLAQLAWLATQLKITTLVLSHALVVVALGLAAKKKLFAIKPSRS